MTERQPGDWIAVTASPDYLRLGVGELQEMVPEMRMARSLEEGIILMEAGISWATLVSRLQSHEPVFVRHICPANHICSLDGGDGDSVRMVETLRRELEVGCLQGRKVATQVRKTATMVPYTPYSVKLAFDVELQHLGAVPTVQEADWVISVLLSGSTAYLGLSRPEENLSDWAGGAVRFRREEGQVSRSKFKLLEAIYVFGLEIVPRQAVLDLGAAPGGWSSALLERGALVTAVDTGELHPSLRDHPGLTFRQANTADLVFRPAIFDLITCDMSWDPYHSMNLLVRLAQALRPGGLGLVTVKLMHRNAWQTILHCQEILSEAYETSRVRQLFHNRDEVTLLLRRKEYGGM